MPVLRIRLATAVIATVVVSGIALPQIVRALDAADGRLIVAQQEDPKKKGPPPGKAPPPQKAPPPPVQKAPPPPPQKQVQPPPQPKVQQQTQPKVDQPKVQPQPKVQQTQPKIDPQPKLAPKSKAVDQPKLAPKVGEPKVEPKLAPKTVEPKADPKLAPRTVEPKADPKLAPKTVEPKADPKLAPKVGEPKVDPKLAPKTGEPKIDPKLGPKVGEPKVGPKQQKKDAQTVTTPQTTGQPKLQPQTYGQPKAQPKGATVGSVNELKGKRKEERKGNQVFIREPGNRVIIRDGNNRLVIRHDESARMRRWGDARFELRGQERYTTVRRGGYEVVTITDTNGRMLRRFRRGPDGREYVLIDNRRRGVGVGAAVLGGAVLLGLAAPTIAIPRERYIVDMGTAPPAYLYEALEAPPVMALERPYSLDEIRDNVELRDRVRSVDINTINFSSGSWEISPDQIPQLQALADAMLKVIGENSSTVFMLEGHTDAVGSAEDNLSLSDRRAESVAEVLTTNFNVPPENLVTQGYGEQHQRVQTEGASRENRRVQVRNITGLMADQGGQPPAGGAPPPGGEPPG